MDFNVQVPENLTTLGGFVKEITHRARTLFEQQAQAQGEITAAKAIMPMRTQSEIDVAQATLPMKEASEIRVKQAESDMARQNASAAFQNLMGMAGGGGGMGGNVNFPPGSSMSMEYGGGRINMPLNREITSEESAVLRGAPQIRQEVENAKQLIKKTGVGTDTMSMAPKFMLGPAAAMSGNQDLARAEALKSIPNTLKIIFGFSMAGKTFSPTEQKAIEALIDPRFKTDPQATADLDKVARLAEYAASLVQNGQAGAKTWAEVMADVGISSTEFQARLGLTQAPETAPQGLSMNPTDQGQSQGLDDTSRAAAILQQRRTRR